MIKVAVVGVGNLGKACIKQIKKNTTFELAAVFSRRPLKSAIPLDKINEYQGKIDVVLACVGSREDAPKIVPLLAKNFNTVDSFDTHAKLADYVRSIEESHAQSTDSPQPKVSIVAAGWDPGLLSVMRLYLTALLPRTEVRTFWGPGVSMGHTNALKQIDGVTDALQITVPLVKANSHKRICYVVTDKSRRTEIKQTILQMPNYFKGQKVEIKFVDRLPKLTGHAGQITAKSKTAQANFKISMTHNAQFTAQVMLAYALANFNMQQDSLHGVFTAADVAPKYLFEADTVNLI